MCHVKFYDCGYLRFLVIIHIKLLCRDCHAWLSVLTSGWLTYKQQATRPCWHWLKH